MGYFQSHGSLPEDHDPEDEEPRTRRPFRQPLEPREV
jgi:hypothetical protein